MFGTSVFDHLGYRRGSGGEQQAWVGRFDYLSDQLAENQLASAATDEAGTSSSPRETQQAAMSGDRRDPGTVSVWARAYGNWGDLDGDENASSFDEEQYGFALGGDVRVAESVTVGLAGGYSDNELDFANGNDIDYDGFQAALYGSFDPGAFYLDALVSYAWYDHDSRRDTGPTGTAKGDYDSEVFSVQGEAGYAFDLMPATVTPFLGARYTRAMTDSYDESGAGAANLDVDSENASSFTTTLGVDLSAEFMAGEGVYIIPELRLGWEHEFNDDHQSIGANFAGVPSSGFTVIGSDVARDSAIVGAGITVDIDRTWQLFLDYDGRINEDYDQHAVSGGVKLSW
jgi:subtilase-type serine protease